MAGSAGRAQGDSSLARAFVILGGLLVLALLGALVAPYFVDWTAYRADFEREASRILGRQVTVHGKAEARLLPFPSVTFSDVEVAGADGTVLMAVDEFRMDAELAPYLSGEILIYSMTLRSPEIRVPISEEGRITWIAERPSVPLGATVVLQSVEIVDGTVLVDDRAANRTVELSAVDADLSADSLAGPFAGTGSFAVRGQTVVFDFSAGSVQDGDRLPVRVRLANEDLDAEISLDGSAYADAAKPLFEGLAILRRPYESDLTETPQDAGDPFAIASSEADVAEDRPTGPVLNAEGHLVLTAELATLADLRVRVGEENYALIGSGTLDFGRTPEFALRLEGEQVDVDRLAAGQGGAKEETDSAAPPASLAERIEAVRRVIAALPRPSLPGSVEIALPVVSFGDTTVRDVALLARPEPDAWRLERFTAELPGRTRLEADGRMAVDEARFVGNLLLASNQPSGFAAWLSGEVDPAIRTLERAGIAGHVTLTSDEQVFDELELDIGGATLEGRLARTVDEGGQTALVADLSGGALNLDAFLALSELMTGDASALPQADSFDVALSAGPVTLDDVRAERIEADFVYGDQGLVVDRLDVSGLAGGDIRASGRISDIVGEARGRLELEFSAERPERFFDFLTRRYDGVPILEAIEARSRQLGPLAVSGSLEMRGGEAGGPPTLLVHLDGMANGSKIDIDSSVENGFAALVESGRFGLDLRLENDAPVVLLSQLGIEAIDVGAPGPMEAELSLSAGAEGPIVASASMRAPGSELSFDGSFKVTPERIVGIESSLYLTSEDVSPWLNMTAVNLGQGLNTLPANMSGSLTYRPDRWSLSDVEGTIAGTAVMGSLSHTGEAPLSGHLEAEAVSGGWLAELVYGRQPGVEFGVGAEGALASATAGDTAPGSRWSDEPFATTGLPAIPFELEYEIGRLDFGQTGLDNVTGHLTGANGELSVDRISGRVAGAVLTGEAVLRNAGGIGTLAFSGETSNLPVTAIMEGASPDAELSGSVKLQGTGQSWAALVNGLTGAGELSVEDVEIPGVPRNVLPALLEVADQEGFVPEEGTGPALRDLTRNASFPIRAARSEFAVAAGIARFTPVTATSGVETLTIAPELDLADLGLGGTMTLRIDPGDDAIQGTEPQINYQISGTLTEPEASLDAQPLTNFLAMRALEREQARVEAMQARLEETLRLRREVRYHRWRASEAERIAAAREVEAARIRQEAEEAERRRQEAARQEAARQEAEARRAAEAAEARRVMEEAQRMPSSRLEVEGNDTVPRDVPRPDRRPLGVDRPAPPTASNGPSFDALPGVENPLDF